MVSGRNEMQFLVASTISVNQSETYRYKSSFAVKWAKKFKNKMQTSGQNS